MPTVAVLTNMAYLPNPDLLLTLPFLIVRPWAWCQKDVLSLLGILWEEYLDSWTLGLSSSSCPLPFRACPLFGTSLSPTASTNMESCQSTKPALNGTGSLLHRDGAVIGCAGLEHCYIAQQRERGPLREKLPFSEPGQEPRTLRNSTLPDLPELPSPRYLCSSPSSISMATGFVTLLGREKVGGGLLLRKCIWWSRKGRWKALTPKKSGGQRQSLERLWLVFFLLFLQSLFIFQDLVTFSLASK